jgi:ABC-type antimicrobial peptide transport system permease subunit
LIDHELRPWRAGAIGFATLGLLAFLVAIVGLAGTVATLAHQRRREIGIRLALGASPAHLTKTLSSRGLWVGLVGVVVGIFLSRLASDRIAGILFGTPDSSNPVTAIWIPAAVFATVAFATLLPALRARGIHPGEVLNEGTAR